MLYVLLRTCTAMIRYKPLAAAMILVERQREDIHRVVEAVGMWESRRDFQRVWEGWEAGFMAFHAFHALSFPWPAFSRGKCRMYRELQFWRDQMRPAQPA